MPGVSDTATTAIADAQTTRDIDLLQLAERERPGAQPKPLNDQVGLYG
jgi:hypothetical protein